MAEVEFAGTDRFAIRRRLGQGGMGVVYEAFDRERGTPIALKTLRLADAAMVYRFKHEFRALADVNHPNLATLHELVKAGDQWFFTMELVEGADFLSWVRPLTRGQTPAPKGGHRGVLDLGRLRGALEQLAEGVAALHAAGKLHRDLKPSNVLVTPQGRVVVLDFGLVSDIGLQPLSPGGSPLAWGTPDYMAPEQGSGAGESLGPASDWYAFGVMLYQALTGRLPFQGTYLEVMLDKQRHEPPPPSKHAADLPGDLDELCRDLLRRDPAVRPEGRAVLHRVGSVTGQRVAVLMPSTPLPASSWALVGRERHLAELGAALTAVRGGKAVTVLLEGASGLGKSALVRHFLDERARQREAVVLAGRCYERESVPYKALDNLIDALSRHLLTLPRIDVEALLPRDILTLARVFPVLRRVEAVVDRPRRTAEVGDPRELRRLAFAALRELFGRLADAETVVLHIDDLQWGDADSAALLADLLRPPDAPPLLVIASYRAEDAATSDVLAQIARGELTLGADVRKVEVGPLATVDAVRLAEGLLSPDMEGRAARAREVAREAGGSPFLVTELCRHLNAEGGAGLPGGASLETMIEARLRRFPPDARRLLEIVSVAGTPIPQAVACRAAGLAGSDLVPLSVLRAGHLVRTRGPRDADLVEPYHDRVRELVVQSLPEAERCDRHHKLAVSLEASGEADPDALALHFRAAGLRDRAAEWAVIAAARAETALAFDRAAELYRLGVEDAPRGADEERALRVKLGEALANAGRGRDAADEFLAAAKGARPAEKLELERRAAEQLLWSGHIDDGLAVIGKVLKALGLHLASTPRMAVASLLWRRARLRVRGLGFTERDAASVPAAQLAEIDTHWAVASALGMVDTVRGAEFQTRHLLLALRAGEPVRLVRALTAEVGYAAVGGAKSRVRAAEVLAKAKALSARVSDAHAHGLTIWASGVLAFMDGRWGEALEHFDWVEVRLRERVTLGMWEVDTARAFALWSLFYMGEVNQILERVPGVLREARTRGDRFAHTALTTGWANLAWLVVGDVEGARRVAVEAMRDWSYQGFHLQHYLELLALGDIDLYEGNGAAAWQRIQGRWGALEKSMQLEIQHNRLEMLYLRGRSALGAAIAEKGELRRRLIGEADHAAAALEREDVQWARGLAHLLRGSVGGGGAGAAAHFAAAVAIFERQAMGLHAAVAQRRLGQTRGGEEGGDLVALADDWMARKKIRDPARFTAMWAPG